MSRLAESSKASSVRPSVCLSVCLSASFCVLELTRQGAARDAASARFGTRAEFSRLQPDDSTATESE